MSHVVARLTPLSSRVVDVVGAGAGIASAVSSARGGSGSGSGSEGRGGFSARASLAVSAWASGRDLVGPTTDVGDGDGDLCDDDSSGGSGVDNSDDDEGEDAGTSAG